MLWIKKIRRRKLQSFMIFIIVMISAMLMTASVVCMTSLKKPVHTLVKETGASDVRVFPIKNDEKSVNDLRGRLLKLSSVSGVVMVNQHYASENILHNNKKIEAFVSFIEYNVKICGKYRFEGQTKGLPGEGECYIPAAFANEFKIKTGDRLLLPTKDKNHTFTVAAIFTEPYSINVSSQISIVISGIPKDLIQTKYLEVFSKTNFSGADVVNDYLQSNDGLLDGNFYKIEDIVRNSSITENILGGIMLAVSLIILAVSCLMIRYMIKNSLIQDSKSIAIYKSIGYSSADIIAIYLKLYMFLTMCGSIIGILLSRIISDGFMNRAFRNILEKRMPGNLLAGILCFTVINGMAMFQIAVSLNKIKKLTPVLIFSGREANSSVKMRKTHTGSEKPGFSPLVMALRNFSRDRKNTCYIILTSVVITYMVYMAIVCFYNIDNMKSDNYYWLGFDEHDVSLTSVNQDGFYERCTAIEDDPAVKRLIRNNIEVKTAIKWQKGTSAAMVYETYDGINMPVVKGRNPKYSNEVVVSGIIAKEFHKEIGDYIDIYLDGSTKVSFLIVGTYQSYYNMGRGIRLLGEAFTQNNVPLIYNEASIYLKAGTDKTAFIQKYRDKYRDAIKIIDRKEKYVSILDSICKPQKLALGPFMAFVMAIGALNILYIIYLKNVMSRKSISIYKSIGYTPMHLVRANLWYVGIIAAASLVIMLPVFLFTFPKVMVLALSLFGFENYRVTYQFLPMLTGGVGILLMFLLSVILSSGSLYRNSISELTQE